MQLNNRILRDEHPEILQAILLIFYPYYFNLPNNYSDIGNQNKDLIYLDENDAENWLSRVQQIYTHTDYEAVIIAPTKVTTSWFNSYILNCADALCFITWQYESCIAYYGKHENKFYYYLSKLDYNIWFTSL